MKRSLETIIDMFWFSLINVVVFGFVSVYLAGRNTPEAAYYILYGMVLWEIVRLTQYSVSLGSLWNMWSRNLSNMFVAPLSMFEYILAEIISSVLKTILIFIMMGIIVIYIFHFNIFQSGIGNIILFFINLSIFAWSLGIFVLGLIFKFGTKIQALAWGLVFIFQPITAVFFPIEILPNYLQTVAYAIPATYVFEAARKSIHDPALDLQSAGIAFLLNILYLGLSILFFKFMFASSRKTGQFARNEG